MKPALFVMREAGMQADKLLTKIAGRYKAILGENLVGIYVHGSLAFGCYNPKSSDIDFLAVTEAEPALAQKEDMIRLLLELTPCAPKKGFEMSGVLLQDCCVFRYPTPYWLHYSKAYHARCLEDLSAHCRSVRGTDPDLAAHFTVVRQVGYPVYGPPAEQVFAPVPREAYLDSLRLDIEDAAKQMEREPVYITLNLCRVAAYLEGGGVLSKAQGTEWGRQNLPAPCGTLAEAAGRAYASGAAWQPGEEEARAFCTYMEKRMKTAGF